MLFQYVQTVSTKGSFDIGSNSDEFKSYTANFNKTYHSTLSHKIQRQLDIGARVDSTLEEFRQKKTIWNNCIHKLGTINITSLVLSLFIGHTPRKKGGVCHWSNPQFNFRAVVQSKMETMLKDTFVQKMKPYESIMTIAGYCVSQDEVDMEKVYDPAYVKDTCNYYEELVNPSMVMSLDNYEVLLKKFFFFVTNKNYDEFYREKDEDGNFVKIPEDDNLECSLILMRTLQHLNQVTNGFARKADVVWYFKKLENLLGQKGPKLNVDTETCTYHELLLKCIQLQQILFPFRISALDGNHRLTFIRELLYAHNTNDLTIPENRVIFLKELTIPVNVILCVANYHMKGIINIPNDAVMVFNQCSLEIASEVGKAMDINPKILMMNYIRGLKEKEASIKIENHDPSIPADFCASLYPPFPRKTTVHTGQIVKSVKEMDLRLPRSTYIVEYDGEDLQPNPETGIQQQPPTFPQLAAALDDRTVTPEKNEDRKRAVKEKRKYVENTITGHLSSTTWLYTNTPISKLKKQNILHHATFLRYFLEDSKHLESELLDDIGDKAKETYKSREGVIGYIIRTLFLRSLFCIYNNELRAPPRTMMTYSLFIVSFIFNDYTKDLMYELLDKNFIPSRFAQEFQKEYIHESTFNDGFPIPTKNPFCSTSSLSSDITFVQKVFAFPVTRIVVAMLSTFDVDGKKSRTVVREDFKVRFYRMIGWDWLRFIQFFGYILPLFIALEPFINEDGIPQISKAFEIDKITNVDLIAEILDKHIRNQKMIILSEITQSFISRFCTVSNTQSDENDQNKKQKDNDELKQGKKKRSRKKPSTQKKTINNMYGGARYIDGTYAMFDIILPKTKKNPNGLVIQNCTLFQVICFLCFNTIWKENNFPSTDKNKRYIHKEDPIPKHYSEMTKEEYFKSNNILYEYRNLVLNQDYQDLFCEPWIKKPSDVAQKQIEESKEIQSELIKIVKNYMTQSTVKNKSKDNEKIELTSISLSTKDKCRKVRDRLKIMREELLRMYYQCHMLNCALQHKQEKKTSNIITGSNIFSGFNHKTFQEPIFCLEQQITEFAQLAFNTMMQTNNDEDNKNIKVSAYAPRVDLTLEKTSGNITMEHINQFTKVWYRSLSKTGKEDLRFLFFDNDEFAGMNNQRKTKKIESNAKQKSSGDDDDESDSEHESEVEEEEVHDEEEHDDDDEDE